MKKMTKKKATTSQTTQPERAVRGKQLYDDTWVPVGKYQLHECCFCKAEHEVRIRWNNDKNMLEEQWKVTKKPPRQPRRPRKG